MTINQEDFSYLKKYFKLYLLLLASLSTFWLYHKSGVGNDSTISEWIINYQGGFTRRGLPGEIAFNIAKEFNLNLRFVIFLMQIFTYYIYLYLVYIFFKKVNFYLIFIFAFFTPIFLTYHLAELEVLARKELFMFIGMLWFYLISNKETSASVSIIWIITVLPIVTILYEATAFYYPFFAAVLMIKYKNIKIFSLFFLIFFSFIPSLVASWFSAFDIITVNEFELMKSSLKQNFNEECYMSCGLMGSKKEAFVHIAQTIDKLTEEGKLSLFVYLFRYSLIMIIGFLPLSIIILNSRLNIKFLFFKKTWLVFVFLSTFIPLHWLMFIDWGRAVNITYVSLLFFMFYLFKNDYVSINIEKIHKKIDSFFVGCVEKIKIISKKSLLIIFFVLYSFGWSPPTLLSADVNSFPGYRIPYKTAKYIYFFYIKKPN